MWDMAPTATIVGQRALSLSSLSPLSHHTHFPLLLLLLLLLICAVMVCDFRFNLFSHLFIKLSLVLIVDWVSIDWA